MMKFCAYRALESTATEGDLHHHLQTRVTKPNVPREAPISTSEEAGWKAPHSRHASLTTIKANVSQLYDLCSTQLRGELQPTPELSEVFQGSC